MKLNKEKFLKTELGSGMRSCIELWDKALGKCSKHDYRTEGYRRAERNAEWCRAQWEVYKTALQQFYGAEYHFTRTDEYFGLVTEDGTDWLFKKSKAVQEGGNGDL